MAVDWAENDGEVVLTATSVQDLVDELEQNQLVITTANKIVAGNVTILKKSVGDRGWFQEGLLAGLRIALELGVP